MLSILVVDDQPEAARRLERGLSAIGHRATVAIDPRDALDLFRTHHFDAVITDIDMPVIDGFELARQLRVLRADVPIAFCSGSPQAGGDPGAVPGDALIGKDWRRTDLAELLCRMFAP